MSKPVTLLPLNMNAEERAASLTSANRRPLPSRLIRDTLDPWACPEHLLPWLAWSWSIDLWSDDWTVERKRRVIAHAARLHRLKGTERGMREHVSLVDGEVMQVLTPPQRFFASRSLTKDETDAWLRSMPQIRIYLAKEIGSAKGLSFIGGFAGHVFARPDTGRALLGRAARLWDRGVETRLMIADISTEREQRSAQMIERVSIPGRAGLGCFVGRFYGHSYAGAVAKSAEIVTYRLQTTYDHLTSTLSLSSARPSLDPVDVRAERISQKGLDKYSAFVGRFVSRGFACPDRAPWLLYDRIVLHDKARAAPMVSAWSFANVSHIGIPAFTAKTVIDAKIKRPLRGMFADHSFVSNDFAYPEDKSRREAVMLAVGVSKAARDRILVTNKLTRPLTFADHVPLDGTITFGSRVKFRL